MVGDIYLAKIYFTNAQNYKLRPILIVKKNSFGDYIYIPFTTNSNNQNSMKINNNDLENGNFRKESYLIIDKTCTIQPNLLDKNIGMLKSNILNDVLSRYCYFLNDK
ncbi:hypothetical protein MNB_SV-15-1012 [hydrothermal vent metagenome]|uniref:Type II toxin-antitoxin system PemK/MazF family toxin n=1 Tax=hydrothermal vent metagenome TaxID=652676 RepID=A0A1W1ELJ7_9ZZZZ